MAGCDESLAGWALVIVCVSACGHAFSRCLCKCCDLQGLTFGVRVDGWTSGINDAGVKMHCEYSTCSSRFSKFKFGRLINLSKFTQNLGCKASGLGRANVDEENGHNRHRGVSGQQ